MLDFPSPATTGQTYSAAGSSWRFDGTKWVETTGALAIPDAPSDGNLYGRSNAAWSSVNALVAPVAANATGALNDAGRNLLHNAVYTIAQRGAGPFTTTGGYTLDRWKLYVTTDVASISQNAIADAGRAAIGDETATYILSNVFTGNSAAGAFNSIAQLIENVRRLAGKTITVSFWAVATVTLRLGLNIGQSFGTGGSPSAFVWAQTTGASVNVTTTWARYSVTFVMPSVIGKTLGTNNDHYSQLSFWYSSGATNNATAGNIGVQSGTINLWGVQLEYGSVATPLDYGGSPADQLQQCQRFFCIGHMQFGGYQVASGGMNSSHSFPVQMRATPTMLITATQTSNNVSTPNLTAYDGTGYDGSVVVTATGAAGWQITWSASADL